MSENLIGEALHPYPDDVVIATKGGLLPSADGRRPQDARPERLRECCDASLRRLRLERIDLYQLHAPDPLVPLEESAGALADLQREGKIRHVGLSNVSLAEFGRARRVVDVVSVQSRYSVTDRVHEPLLEACERHGIAFVPWFPLADGRLANARGVLDEIARVRRGTPAQVALAWLLKRSAVTLPIPGTGSIDHLEENVAAATLELTGDEVDRLSVAGSNAARATLN